MAEPENKSKQVRNPTARNPTGVGGFKKGQSGNPGGRTKEIGHVRELARQYTEAAVKTLAEIMVSETENGRARVAASEALLDRAWGKPAQALTGEDGEGPPRLVIEIVDPTRRTPG